MKSRTLLAAGAMLGLLASTRIAGAHAIGLSRGEYRATEQGIDVTLILARAEAVVAWPALDRDRNETIDESALSGAARADLAESTIDKVRVTTESGPCTGTLVAASLTAQDGLELRARYTCPSASDRVSVTFGLLGDLTHGHRHAAHVEGASSSDHLLFRGNDNFVIERSASSTSSGSLAEKTESSAPRDSSFERALAFARMGVEHILTGYDHMLFVFALVLAGGTMRSLALAITAFTAAHSLTLALAVLGVVSPPVRLIEPAIALSVAYVGVENFFARPADRWKITFPFGLLHGFGFAGALGEAAVPRSEIPTALFAFNVGVELGQLAWIALLGLLLARLRRFDWFGRRAVPMLSAVVVVFGVVWFASRLSAPARGAVGANDVASSPACPASLQ